jgi:regulation of enolase protein 1 (concanavalin A-like superfamily)
MGDRLEVCCDQETDLKRLITYKGFYQEEEYFSHRVVHEKMEGRMKVKVKVMKVKRI